MGCCHSKEYSDNKITRYDGPDRTKAPDAPKNPESRAEAPHYDSSAMMPTVTVILVLPFLTTLERRHSE